MITTNTSGELIISQGNRGDLGERKGEPMTAASTVSVVRDKNRMRPDGRRPEAKRAHPVKQSYRPVFREECKGQIDEPGRHTVGSESRK